MQTELMRQVHVFSLHFFLQAAMGDRLVVAESLV